jgi:hypothetical protein
MTLPTPLKQLLAAVTLVTSLCTSSASMACDFKPLKLIIDQVTDLKTKEGQKFKEQMEDGWNSIRILFDMTPKDIHPQFDECRHEVDEYLNKIGYPPVH